MYFLMRIAVARMGGPTLAAQALGLPPSTVSNWLLSSQRTRPAEPVLQRLADASGVPLQALLDYHELLGAFKEREGFRRGKG